MRTYEDTLDWMFAQLPMYQREGKSAFKKDLSNSLLLSSSLGNPHKKYKTIHVGGTNGKGSTSHMLASILQESGLKVGLYTSPHLIDFRERIKVNGVKVSEKFVMDFIESNYSFLEENKLSFFEMTVGMAFQYFEKQKVDVAIIEVGLGGRLDSTNIIKPILSVITNISLDHTNMLGDTLAKIAYEKAGIIKKEVPVVIGEKKDETEDVFKEKAKAENALIVFAEDLVPKHIFSSDLKGIYQERNIRTVLVALEELAKFFPLTINHVRKGLCNVMKNTEFLGRWQLLSEKPTIICDTGHNEAGIKEVVKQLATMKKKRLHLVLGFVKDKDVSKIMSLFPDDAYYYFGEPNIPRKMGIEDLKKQIDKKKSTFFNKISEAFFEAKNTANEEDIIFVGGSTFVVAEILQKKFC